MGPLKCTYLFTPELPTMLIIIFWFCRLLVFSPCMCPLESIVSSGAEVDSVVFGQFWNVLLLFSGVMLRSLFTITYYLDG